MLPLTRSRTCAAWFVILPLAAASPATGMVQAPGTPWGLLRHYWVVFKLLLIGVATVVLLLKMGPIDNLARAAAQTAFSSADLVALRTSLAAGEEAAMDAMPRIRALF